MSELLNASHLEAEEKALLDGQAPEVAGLTLADVVEAMRRIAYHQRKIAEERAEAEALIAPLLAEVERIKAWQTDREAPRLKSITFHESKGVAYYKLNPPPSKGGKEVKTIKGPGWTISAKDPAPKWLWQDDEAVSTILAKVAPEFVRTEPVVDKNKVKAATESGRVRVQDGKVYAVWAESGELVELAGVTVSTAPTEYTVKVD